MKPSSNKYFILGLTLSGLASVFLLFLLVIQALTKASIYQPKNPASTVRTLWITLGVVILGFAITALSDPFWMRQFFSGRQVRHGSAALITFFSVTGIIISINLIVYQNPKRWDLTEDKDNSLSKETISLLHTLPQTIYARAYFSTQIDTTEIRNLLENLKQNSTGKFQYEFIDPNTNPVAANNDGITRDGTIILNMGEYKEMPTYNDEQELSSAIVRLINPDKAHIYFLTGHGETDIEQTEDTSLSSIRIALENKNYIASTLNFQNDTDVPKDTKVLIICNPQTPLTTSETELLNQYLDQGGALIVMSNPNYLTQIGQKENPLNTLLMTWGISPQNDIIYDPNSNPPLLVYANPLNYASHPITNNLRGINTSFYTSQSLKLIDNSQNYTLTSLAETYPEAWGEMNNTSIENNEAGFDASIDHSGPLILAALSVNATSNGRLIVFGDSDFASNALYKFGNGDILLKSIDWAAQKEFLINLASNKSTYRTYVPPGNLGLVGIITFSVCGLPLFILIGGVTTSISRRKKS